MVLAGNKRFRPNGFDQQVWQQRRKFAYYGSTQSDQLEKRPQHETELDDLDREALVELLQQVWQQRRKQHETELGDLDREALVELLLCQQRAHLQQDKRRDPILQAGLMAKVSTKDEVVDKQLTVTPSERQIGDEKTKSVADTQLTVTPSERQIGDEKTKSVADTQPTVTPNVTTHDQNGIIQRDYIFPWCILAVAAMTAMSPHNMWDSANTRHYKAWVVAAAVSTTVLLMLTKLHAGPKKKRLTRKKATCLLLGILMATVAIMLVTQREHIVTMFEEADRDVAIYGPNLRTHVSLNRQKTTVENHTMVPGPTLFFPKATYSAITQSTRNVKNDESKPGQGDNSQNDKMTGKNGHRKDRKHRKELRSMRRKYQRLKANTHRRRTGGGQGGGQGENNLTPERKKFKNVDSSGIVAGIVTVVTSAIGTFMNWFYGFLGSVVSGVCTLGLPILATVSAYAMAQIMLHFSPNMKRKEASAFHTEVVTKRVAASEKLTETPPEPITTLTKPFSTKSKGYPYDLDWLIELRKGYDAQVEAQGNE